MKTTYFTLREKNNEECPNMGTIGIEHWGKLEHDKNGFYNKIREAIMNHFDCNDEELVICDDIEFHLIFNAYPMDFKIEVDGEPQECSIEQTFLY